MTGLGLHVYASRMVNESRIERITAALEDAGIFREVRLVGIPGSGLPARERLSRAREIVRLGRPPSSARESSAAKLLRMLAWFRAVYREHRHQDVRAVSAHSVWVLPVSYALARRHNALLVYNPHELESGAASVVGLKRVAARLIEFFIIPKCSAMSVVNQSIADWYSEHSRARKIITVRNIPLVGSSDLDLRAALDVSPQSMLFIHTGRLVPGRSIPQILEAFEGQEQAHLVFLGDGQLTSEVSAAARRNSNIRHLPPVPAAEVVEVVRQADVALVLIEPSCLSYELSSPNKLFEALAAGTPPLCTDLPEARRHLAGFDEWILTSGQKLTDRIRSMDQSDVQDFRSRWEGLPDWPHEVADLVAAYAHHAALQMQGGDR